MTKLFNKNLLQNLACSQAESEGDNPSVPTLKINNEEFLQAIFRNLPEDQRALVCGFKGHPGNVPSANWVGLPYLPGETSFDPERNSYFTLSTIVRDAEEKWRRRKINFAAQHVLVLDDIGTKAVGLDQLPLSPSYVIETSPGNYQAGYIFSEPVVDGMIAERLMNAIIAAGLCDPGAGGPLARYARLPVGKNGKHDPPFPCLLLVWHPERRYSVDEIIEGFKLEWSVDQEITQGTESDGHINTEGITSKAFLPSLRENPVITRLKELNLYKKTSDRKGMHDIVCFWKNEHTGNQDGGTSYFEPTNIRRSGGFKCFHKHCKNRTIFDLCKILNIDIVDAGNWPRIRIIEGYMNEIIDSIEKVIAKTGKFYQRGGEIVRIYIDPYTKQPIIFKYSFSLFIRFIDFLIRFERYDKRSDMWLPCNPSILHCKMLFEGGEYKYIPILHRLTWQPYLRPDLSLMTEPGYDKELGFFGVFCKEKYPINQSPTPQQAKEALVILKKLLMGFCFKSEYDEAAALSAIITATIRPSLPLAPMIHCRAPQASSGKSFLCSLFRAFATATLASAVGFPASDEECAKSMLALLRGSPAVVCFDNCIRDIVPYKSLCSILTEEYYTDRVLGGSTVATVSTKVLFTSSGNNVSVFGDMCRRVVTIDLDPACENPAQRSFEMYPVENPVATVLANREYYVCLVFTIVMAWLAAGSPRANVPPIASYNLWSDLCRHSLIWLGCPDPATSLFRSLEDDPDREVLGRLLHAWYACFENRPKMIREAIDMASHELEEVFMDIAAGDRGSINRKRLGRWISRHANRIVDGFKFEKESGTRSAEAWRVESLSSVISISKPTDTESGSCLDQEDR